MKILQLSADYLGSKIYTNLFSALELLGVKNTVFVSTKTDQQPEITQHRDVHVTKHVFSALARFLYIGKQYSLWREIVALKLYKDIDVVHAHTLFSNGLLAYWLKKKYGIPYIVAVRDTDVNVFFSKMPHLRSLGNKILKNADKIIFLSIAYNKKVIEQYVSTVNKKDICQKTEVIPNGIDTFFRNNLATIKSVVREKQIHLIYIGRINTRKNIETTIAACCELMKRGLEVTYTIVGAIEEDYYYKLISSYPFINYKPQCALEELINYYRQADIFVMPSLTETFGLVYAEAMSQGLPVIYTKEQGFDGHFPDGEVGFAVESNKPSQIADRVIDIINNYQVISNNCINKVAHFNWDTIATRYQSIYTEINNN